MKPFTMTNEQAQLCARARAGDDLSEIDWIVIDKIDEAGEAHKHIEKVMDLLQDWGIDEVVSMITKWIKEN